MVGLSYNTTSGSMSATKLFLDTEFTGLNQNAQLISLAVVAESGQSFYAEFTDFDTKLLSDWHHTHVVPNLLYWNLPDYHNPLLHEWRIKGQAEKVVADLKLFLQQFILVEIWADVLAYDWVLFCELFGGALNLPDNIFYTPFDLATLFRFKDLIVPSGRYKEDVPRFDFVKYTTGPQHNALHDAMVELQCYRKLMGI